MTLTDTSLPDPDHFVERRTFAVRFRQMPTFEISIVNESFSSSNDHEEHSLDEATTKALTGALQIGAGEVISGKNLFAAEVRVSTANEVVRRFVVSVSASPLQLPG